jgi:hypothetical protein
LETLLLLFNKYKDVPSKSTGSDACAGAYLEKLLSARMLFPFLLSLVLYRDILRGYPTHPKYDGIAKP